MASIRRTLSPAYHDRTYQNGTAAVNSPLSLSSSPSQKFFTKYSSSSSSSSSSVYSAATSAFAAFFSFSTAMPLRRKGFRRSLYRCLLFFVLGLVLGMFPFGHVDNDIRSHDFSFEIMPPHVNVQLDDGDNRSIRHDGIALRTLSLGGVDTQVMNSVSRFDYVERKQLIVVTPTYNRVSQAYFLNRLGQVLRLVQPPLLWIVVEMKAAKMETAEVLRKTGVMYRHLVCMKNSTNVKDRGVHQRNAALEHIERHRLDGIVYFADDDNIYSLKLFESLREIK